MFRAPALQALLAHFPLSDSEMIEMEEVSLENTAAGHESYVEQEALATTCTDV